MRRHFYSRFCFGSTIYNKSTSLKQIFALYLVTSRRNQNKAWQHITAPTSNFLRVNAQMRKLTKQKTVSSCKTLAASVADDRAKLNDRQNKDDKKDI